MCTTTNNFESRQNRQLLSLPSAALDMRRVLCRESRIPAESATVARK